MWQSPLGLRLGRGGLLAAVLAGGQASLAFAEAERVPGVPEMVFSELGLSERSSSVSLGAAWSLPWSTRWWEAPVVAHFEVSVAHWRGSEHLTRPEDPRSFTRVGVTPAVRWYVQGSEAGFFVEAGIGVNWLVPVYRVGGRRFSTGFNFGDHLGVGRRLGVNSEHEIALRVQHFSNAGIREPNPGEDFLQLRYARRF